MKKKLTIIEYDGDDFIDRDISLSRIRNFTEEQEIYSYTHRHQPAMIGTQNENITA